MGVGLPYEMMRRSWRDGGEHRVRSGSPIGFLPVGLAFLIKIQPLLPALSLFGGQCFQSHVLLLPFHRFFESMGDPIS